MPGIGVVFDGVAGFLPLVVHLVLFDVAGIPGVCASGAMKSVIGRKKAFPADHEMGRAVFAALKKGAGYRDQTPVNFRKAKDWFRGEWKKLKTGFEPNSDGNTGKEADDVEESLKENDDDGDTGAHSFLG